MQYVRFTLILTALGLTASGCDVKKSPESAAVSAPEPPRPIATENTTPAVPAAEPAASVAAEETPRPAASEPEPGPSPSAPCEARKAALKARFAQAAHCQADVECELILPGCPFGCGLAVNRSTDVGQLKRDIAAFKSECNDCMYRCRPPSGPPICRAGACSFSAHAAK